MMLYIWLTVYNLNQMSKDKDSKQSIQVTIRVRPLSEKQQTQDSRVCVKVEAQSHSIHMLSNNQIKKFTFDSICANDTQEDMFEKVGKKSTINCLEGYNCTIFAYGQTGAGKTFTMMGVNAEHQRYFELRGLIPRTLEYLFECIDQQRQKGVDFIIRCSFLQIYNEQIIDLLNKNNSNLQIREDSKKGVYVEGVSEELINKSEEAMDILNKGFKSRHVGSTYYNETSSRSHSVFTMQIQSKQSRNGVVNTKSRHFHFIDLAGSQRTKQIYGERLKEGCSINKALLNLGTVINALSECSEGKPKYVNYRDSKLTFLLKDSLGGNSKTHLIANISPSTMFCNESLSTLGFARRVKLIKREKASINEDSTGNLQSMKNQIKRLKQQIIALKSNGYVQKNISENTQSQESSNMTGMLKQYVSEEIDKQTKLEVEILKLNNRILQLQKGIKSYSSNEIHLRMAIKVYEDKLNRLKEVEKTLSSKINSLTTNQEQSLKVIQYFKNQRQLLLKELEILKQGNDQSKYIKQLLKQTKLYQQQKEDQSLQNILGKNNEFLQKLKERLEELKPEKKQIEFTEQFQKKISQIEIQFERKEEELNERIQQLHLQNSEMKTTNEQNQNLLKQAISDQIILEERLNTSISAYQTLQAQLQNEKTSKINLITEKEEIVKDYQDKINQFKLINQKNAAQIDYLTRELDQSNAKYASELENNKKVKEQLQTLNSEKDSLQKLIIQKSQEINQMRSEGLKQELQIKLNQQTIESLKIQTQDLKVKETNFQQKYAQQRKQWMIKMEQIQISFKQQFSSMNNEKAQVEEELKEVKNKLKQLQIGLAQKQQETSRIQEEMKAFKSEATQEIREKQEKISELMRFINEKEANNSETSNELDKTKVELINAQSDRDIAEGKLKKIIKDLEEKLAKEVLSYKHLENVVNQKNQQYELLSVEHAVKKKEFTEISDKFNKLNKTLTDLQESYAEVSQKYSTLSQEYDQVRNKEKDVKLQTIEITNQLYALRKNTEIQIDSYKTNISNKEQQIDQLQKEVSKLKIKYENKVSELMTEIQKNKQIHDKHQQSLRNTMETYLSAKEKKICQISTLLQNKESIIKNKVLQVSSVKEVLSKLEEYNKELQKSIEDKLKINGDQVSIIQKLNQEISSLKNTFEIQLEEKEISHNQQLDKKNQEIDQLLSENQKYALELQEKDKNYEQLTASNSKTMSELNQNKLNIEQLSKNLQKKDEEISDLKLKIQAKKKQNQTSNAELTIILNENKKFQEEIATLKEKINVTAAKNETFSTQISKLQNQTTSYEQQIQKLAILQKKYDLAEEKIKELQQNQFQMAKEHSQRLKDYQLSTHSELASAEKSLKTAQNQKKQIESQLNSLKQKFEAVQMQLNDQKQNVESLSSYIQQLKNKQSASTSQNQKLIKSLENDNKTMSDELLSMEKRLIRKQEEAAEMSEKIKTYSEEYQKMSLQIQDLTQQNANHHVKSMEIEKLKYDLLNQRSLKEKLNGELNKEKDLNNNLKMIIENSQCQKNQLQIELEEKDSIYKKLLEKIAKNDIEKTKQPNSQHYLKTVELLQKSRTQQLQLKKQNDELKKAISKLKEELQSNYTHVEEVEQKSEEYCISMHKRLEQIQNSYFQLEHNHEKALKEKKQQAQQNETLKEQIQRYKNNALKLAAKIEELQVKYRHNNKEFIELQKEFDEVKKNQLCSGTGSAEEKAFINKLKSENSSLRMQKHMLAESLNKQKDEKIKLKSELRYGKETQNETYYKIEIDKKINQNKYLQDIIFQITNSLKITVVEPKTKLEAIRSIILGTIKEKNNEILHLINKCKQLQMEVNHLSQKLRLDINRDHKALSISNGRTNKELENVRERDKELSGKMLNNTIRSKINQFQTNYSQLRQSTEQNRSLMKR